jgi:hypothetical protein
MKRVVLLRSMYRGLWFSGTDFSSMLVFECFRNTGVGLSAGSAVVVFNRC